MSEWYVAVDGKQQGPFGEAELIERIRRGEMGRAAHVFAHGMANWEPISSRHPFAAALGVTDGRRRHAANGRARDRLRDLRRGDAVRRDDARPRRSVHRGGRSFMYMDPGIEIKTIFGDGTSSRKAAVSWAPCCRRASGCSPVSACS